MRGKENTESGRMLSPFPIASYAGITRIRFMGLGRTRPISADLGQLPCVFQIHYNKRIILCQVTKLRFCDRIYEKA